MPVLLQSLLLDFVATNEIFRLTYNTYRRGSQLPCVKCVVCATHSVDAFHTVTPQGWSCDGSGTFHCTTLTPTSIQKFVERLRDAKVVPRLVVLTGGERVRTSWLFLLPKPWSTRTSAAVATFLVVVTLATCVIWQFPQALHTFRIELSQLLAHVTSRRISLASSFHKNRTFIACHENIGAFSKRTLIPLSAVCFIRFFVP